MAGVNKLQDMTFDEVSLVRRPANQHATIVLSKADEGDDMPGVLFTEDGQEIDIDDLEIGTEIEMEDGQIYTVVPADESDDDGGYEEDFYEESEYGKSADDAATDYASAISKAYAESVDEEQRAALFATVAKSAEIARYEAAAAQERLAKMHEDSYVRECISKAEEYGFAGPKTAQFGVAISKMLRVLEPDEMQLMDDIFKSFAELIDAVEIGSEAGSESDVLDVVHGAALDIVKSADGALTTEQAMAAAFDANPELYGLYLSEKEGF